MYTVLDRAGPWGVRLGLFGTIDCRLVLTMFQGVSLHCARWLEGCGLGWKLFADRFVERFAGLLAITFFLIL